MQVSKIIKSRPFIYSALGLTIIILIIIFVKKVIGAPGAKNDDVVKAYKNPANKTATGTTSWQNIAVFPLRLGSKNYFVGQIQTLLKNFYKAKLEVDNDFGPLTQAAVIKHLGTNEILETQYDAYVIKYKILPRISVMDQYKKEQDAKVAAQNSIWGSLIKF